MPCQPYDHQYDYTCTTDDCGGNCGCLEGFERDCNCNCKVPEANNYAYLTDCGCNINGGVCPSQCAGNYGLGDPFFSEMPNNYYCHDTNIECPILEGCTDPNADNYNPDATVDDGTCEFDPGEPIETIMYKPSIERIWSFNTTNSSISDPTPGQQIDNFSNSISAGVFDISNIYYLNLKINNNSITNTESMIFAFINNQLRGYANVTEQGYCYLEVKWKQQLENNTLITFYLKHENQIKLINNIKTHNNQLVENSYTTDYIYINE